MLSNAGIVTFGPVTGSRVWSGAGTMLPQTIIWYAMLMRSVIKAERTRTANRILSGQAVSFSRVEMKLTQRAAEVVL